MELSQAATRYAILRKRNQMQLEIDPELNQQALAEAAERYPEFAGRARTVKALPLFRGYAWQVEWAETPPPAGQDAWEFQNAAIRAYKRLASITG